MRTKKSSGLSIPVIALKLLTHAMMGVALGLSFGLALAIVHPAAGTLLTHGGTEATVVFLATLLLTFAIGATLTGIVFILDENNDS